MPRPRTLDLDSLLDSAERLAVSTSVSAVTIRAVSADTGVSNGAIYHAYGSRMGLLGAVWIRAARWFLEIQQETAREVTEFDAPGNHGVNAVVAAADAPSVFTDRHPASAQFLLGIRREEILGSDELPEQTAEQLQGLDAALTEIFIELARGMWSRSDRSAVDVIRDCIVELPTALILRGGRTSDPAARARLAAAVRAVLSLGPDSGTAEDSHQASGLGRETKETTDQ